MNKGGRDLERFLVSTAEGGLPLILSRARERDDLHPDIVKHLEEALKLAEDQLNLCRKLRALK